MTPWGLTEGYFVGIVITFLVVLLVIMIVFLTTFMDAIVDIKKARLKVEEARERRLRAEAEERMGVKYEVVEGNEEVTKVDPALD